ncbi:hypothetical protein SELMODRAFT_34012, partial [Selaginella moellendorffii]
LINAYAERGVLERAQLVFENVPQKDVYCWTIMITANAIKGNLDSASKLFRDMPQHSIVTWTAMVQAFGENGNIQESLNYFSKMPERNSFAWTALIIAHIHGRDLDGATRTFRNMPDHNIVSNVVSWTAMMASYAQYGHFNISESFFQRIPGRNLVTWNALIAAAAQSGHARLAIELFHEMIVESVEPDEISFMIALAACAHLGLLDLGRSYFASMLVDHGGGLAACKEHYTSMVDLLGRAGQIDAAAELIDTMPFVPGGVSLVAILGSCQTQRDLPRATRAARRLLEIDPRNSSSHVLLSS